LETQQCEKRNEATWQLSGPSPLGGLAPSPSPATPPAPPTTNRRLVAPTNYATCNAIGGLRLEMEMKTRNEKQPSRKLSFAAGCEMGNGRWALSGGRGCYCCCHRWPVATTKAKATKTPAGSWLKRGRGSGTTHRPSPIAQLALAIPTEAEVSSRRRRLWAHLQRKSSRSALLLPLLLLLLLLLHAFCRNNPDFWARQRWGERSERDGAD